MKLINMTSTEIIKVIKLIGSELMMELESRVKDETKRNARDINGKMAP